MGGRGSCYLNFNNPNDSSGADFNFDIGNPNDEEDTQKEYNGKTEKLLNKNIHIKVSTDKIPEDIFIPNIKKVDSLSRKYKTTANILQNTNQDLNIRAHKMPTQVQACFSSNAMEFNNLQIVLNKDLTIANKKAVENTVQEQIDSGFWTKSDKKELINHTPTHEYGHYIQKILMEQDSKTEEGKKIKEDYLQKYAKSKNKRLIAQSYSEECATKYFKQIQKINRREFGKESPNDISRYGTTNNRECFAELFANANTTSKPNNLSKSLEIFLKERKINNDAT